MKRIRRDSLAYFTLPVAAENILAMFVSMVFSSIVSRVSGSALAAMGTVNTFVNFLNGFAFLVTMSSAVLVARLVGEKDSRSAGEMVEQGTFLALVTSLFATAVCLVATNPIVGFLSPNAEPALWQDTRAYYMVMMASYPFLVVYNTASGVLRASGDSRTCLVCAVLLNGVQLILAWVFVGVLGLGMVGAGLSFVGCRVVGCAALVWRCFGKNRHYTARFSRCFRPRWQAIRRMLRLGTPGCVEQMSVQGGYMLGNSLVVGLGTAQASIYNVINTVNNFPNLVLGVVSTVTVTAVGNLIGAKQYAEAKKKGLLVLGVGAIFTFVLYLVVTIFSGWFTGLYTEDAYVFAESRRLIWLLALYQIPALSVNMLDSALRTGGDTRFVMTLSTIAVWVVRLPLTLLLCYYFELGALGALLANYVALYVRAGGGFIRYLRGKWLYMRV